MSLHYALITSNERSHYTNHCSQTSNNYSRRPNILPRQGQITGAGTHDELIAQHEPYKEFTHGQGLS